MTILELQTGPTQLNSSQLGFLGAIALRKVDEPLIAYLRTDLIFLSPEIYLDIYSSFDKINKCN